MMLPRIRELPPRARRIHSLSSKGAMIGGTTSACAENTLVPPFSTPRQGNYLRVRGEYLGFSSSTCFTAELPPRARRILKPKHDIIITQGTTSACAENTR